MRIILIVGIILGVLDTIVMYCCVIAAKQADEKGYADSKNTH